MKWDVIMLKKIFDTVLALVLIIILMPFYVVISFYILIQSGKPILFRQLRPGYKGKLFYIYKFRTMSNERDVNGALLPDEKRLTRIGQLMRRCSLDEIPQLFNVLKGDMSFVGPRPLLVEYLELYNAKQRKRHDILPGITGWAQVNGRNAISWNEKFEYDIWYVENYSFGLDMKILWITFFNVLRQKDINATDVTTMEKFKGNS